MKQSWFRKILTQADYLTGRYEAFLVENASDRAACMDVLDQVRRVELNRVVGKTVLESAAFADMEVKSVLFGCRDTRDGQMVGCMRGTPVPELLSSDSSREEYCFDLLDEGIYDRTIIATRLAILKPYRKTAASLVLFDASYRWGLENGYLLVLQTCEPGLYNSYLRLGCRPFGPIHSSSTGGFRIPMVLVMHDRDHLEHCRSPVLRTLAKMSKEPLPQDGIHWYASHVASKGRIHTGMEPFHDEESGIHEVLTHSMSEEGKKALFTNAMTVECEVGKMIIRKEDGGHWLGIVESGMVKVERDGRVVCLLGEGEPFGEIALILNRPRTADIIAAVPGTKVILLSQTALDRVTNTSDREALWRNTSVVLARRLTPY